MRLRHGAVRWRGALHLRWAGHVMLGLARGQRGSARNRGVCRLSERPHGCSRPASLDVGLRRKVHGGGVSLLPTGGDLGKRLVLNSLHGEGGSSEKLLEKRVAPLVVDLGGVQTRQD